MAHARPPKIIDHLFLDVERLAQFHGQLPEDSGQTTRDVVQEASLGITGPAVKRSETTRRRQATPSEQLEQLRKYLVSSGDVARRRPLVMDHSTPRFVEESMVATKVIIPVKHAREVPGLKSIAVWVSDPDPADLSMEPFRWSGTFLYLVESFWDSGEFSTVYSGCSALQAIANVALGRDSIFHTRDEREPLGRDTYEHPIEKLKALDVLVQAPRRIKALYRKRYLTNEQCWTFGGQQYRVNDLLAYPLYISSE